MITSGTRVRVIPHPDYPQQMFGFAVMLGLDTDTGEAFIIVAGDDGDDHPVWAEYVKAVSIEEEAVALIRSCGGRDAARTDAGQRARNARATGHKRLADFYATVAVFLSNA